MQINTERCSTGKTASDYVHADGQNRYVYVHPRPSTLHLGDSPTMQVTRPYTKVRHPAAEPRHGHCRTADYWTWERKRRCCYLTSSGRNWTELLMSTYHKCNKNLHTKCCSKDKRSLSLKRQWQLPLDQTSAFGNTSLLILRT